MELQIYLRMIQRGWWIVALTALAALNGSLVFSYITPPAYRTSARLLISPNLTQGNSGNEIINTLDTLSRSGVVETYAEILKSDRVYNDTAGKLGLSAETAAEYTRETVVLPNSSVIQITISGPDPKLVATLANAVSQQTITFSRQINQVFVVNVLDTAVAPTEPYSPQPVRDATLALALGLVVGVVLAILREQIRAPLDALRRRSRMDGASAAYNRRYFQNELGETLTRAPQAGLSLGLIRLEGLTDLIDTLPLIVSQRLLQDVTRTLRKELRGSDSVGRWGATEFAVLLPATPESAAQRTVERIRQALAVPVPLDQATGEMLDLRPVVGVAASQPADNVQVLVERAENALKRGRPAA